MKRRRIVRVDVQVRQEDVALARDIAHALNSPDQAGWARALPRARFEADKAQGLKAPLEGIDFKRSRDTGRNIDL